MITRTQFALRLAATGSTNVEDLSSLLRSELQLGPTDPIPILIHLDAALDALTCEGPGGVRGGVTNAELLDAVENEESIYCLLLSSLLDTSLRDPILLAELSGALSLIDTLPLAPPHAFTVSAEAQRALGLVREHPAVALIGRSSSGKSLIARYVQQKHVDAGGSALWLGLSRPGQKALAIYAAAVATKELAVDRLVVVDDVQSAPHVATRLIRVWKALGVPNGRLLMASWPDGEPIVSEIVPMKAILRLNGFHTARQIASELVAPWGVREEILAISDGDALVADLAAENYRQTQELCSASELSRLGFERLTNGQALSSEQSAALYEIACLASYEIEVDPRFMATPSKRVVDQLARIGVVRRRLPYVHLGHRSLGRLVAMHLRSQDGALSAVSPVGLAVRYLQAAGPTQIQQTLDRLDLVAISGQADQFGAAFLAESWSNLRVLVGLLSRQVESDATWGDNVASAVFAAEAFAALGDADHWMMTANYVRDRWQVDGGEALPKSNSETSEADDFKAIQEAMREEDLLAAPIGMPAGDLDVDRFHRTWVLGLLLGFEGSALVPDSERSSELLAMAARTQLPSGAFYPERVPWVTARVVLGLGSLGAHAESSPVTDAACRWLRTRAPAGPYSFGVWKPGTGRWNTDLATTALTLLSLGRAGVSPADTCVRRGAAYLRDARSEWNIPGKEIDCAQAVEAALVLGGGWRDFASEIRGLSVWAKDVGAWARVTALATDVQDESSKISAVAGALVGIIWAMVRQELPVLFEGVGRMGEPARGSTLEDRPVEGGRRVILASLTTLRTYCLTHVSEREALVARRSASSEVRATLEDWRDRLRRIDTLIEEAAAPSLNATEVGQLAARINALGVLCMGDAWEVIQ